MVSKYRNKAVTVDNIRFASRREAARYQELKLLLGAGLITNLQLQVPYAIVVNGKPVAKYLADFRYTDSKGRTMIEDSKGFTKNPTYRLKKKLVEALYDVKIEEV